MNKDMNWYENLVNPNTQKPQVNIEAPKGFHDQSKPKTKPTPKPSKSQLDSLKTKKAWDIAMGPAKQIPMNLLMSYMSGSSLQIIPISMTLMLFSSTFMAILSVNTAFKGLETTDNYNDVLMSKSAYLFLQMVIIGIGIFKLNSMGLIPTTKGDWLSWEQGTRWSIVTV